MSRAPTFAFAALLSLTVALGAAPARKAPAPTATPSSNVPVAGWTLETEQLDGDTGSGDFSAPSHVHLTRTDGSVIDADRATGNYKRRQAQLYGHVQVNDTSGTFGMSSAQNAPREAATLACDELRVDGRARAYDAQGSVHYVQGQSTADADRAHLNDKTHRLQLDGKVHVVQGERSLVADRALYDTVTGHGEADGNVRMEFPGVAPSIATPKPLILRKKGGTPGP